MLLVRIFVFYSICCCCLPVITLCSPWSRRQRNSYCKTPDSINNAIMTRRNSLLRITCQRGYTLQGPRLIECVHGKWVYDEKPVCSKYCNQDIILPTTDHGITRIEEGYKATVLCHSGYIVAGNRVAYCNGDNGDTLDRPLGLCRRQSDDSQNTCDFETDDLCGWSIEIIENHQWKRKSAVNILGFFNTGPQHDHTIKTKSNGHFMIMESLREYGVYVPLISPIYQRGLSLMTACCFRFYYFMYGIGIGDLYVFVKPLSIHWENLMDYASYMKFNISGHQESSWKEATFSIPEMDEDFQIVFLAKSSKSHLSDIAIDDVSLMVGADCPRPALPGTTKAFEDTEDTTTPEPAIADTQTCASRCFDRPRSGIITENGKLYLYCNCHLGCEETQSCCSDYRSECLGQLFTEMAEENNTTTKTATPSTTTTTKSITTTTTTKKLMKTTRIATTTTPMPPTTTTPMPPTTITSTTEKAKTSTTLKIKIMPTLSTNSKTIKTTITTTTTKTSTPTTTRLEIPKSSSSTANSTKINVNINFTTIPTAIEIMSTTIKNKILPATTTLKSVTTTNNYSKDKSAEKQKVKTWKYESNESIIEHPNERGALLITFTAVIIIILIAAGFRCKRNIHILLKIKVKNDTEEIKDMAKFSNNHTPSIEIYQGTTVSIVNDGDKSKKMNKFFKSKKDEMSEPLWDDESPTSDL